jgi:hypothetical protein
MSQINFEALARQHPEYERALRKLDSWMRRQADLHVINPKSLAKEITGVDEAELAGALTLLQQAGHLRRVYKVLTPSGVITDGEFEDPTKIPERLPDRFENYFDTAEADILPIFRMVV